MRDQTKSQTEKVFLSHLSHRIRTPLNSVIGFSKLLLNKDVDNRKTKEFAGRILESGYEILHYFQNMMDISEIETGMISPHPEYFELNHSLEELISEFKIRFQNERNIRLDYYYTREKKECFINTDNSILRRIVGNLIEISQHLLAEGKIQVDFEEHGDYRINIYIRGISDRNIKETNRLLEPSESYNIMDPDSLEYLTCKATEKLSFLINGNFELEKRTDKEIRFKVEIPNLHYSG